MDSFDADVDRNFNRYLHPTLSRHEMCTPSVSNVVCYKFSHDAASSMLYRKIVSTLEGLICIKHI